MINPKIEIAVLDDGINEDVYDINVLDYNIEINEYLEIKKREKYNKSIVSHGTTCAAIIKLFAKEAQISSIKILDSNNKRGEKNQLIKALYWCSDNGIRIVNISAGTIDFRDFQEVIDCINEVTQKGVIIIAACNNKNIYTVPASLSNVIGVKCDIHYENDQYSFNKYALDGIDITASGKHYLKNRLGDANCTNPSNSYAAPFITAKVYKILSRNPKFRLEEIKAELYKEALNFKEDDYNPYLCLYSNWINQGLFNTTNYELSYIQQDLKICDSEFYRECLLSQMNDKVVNIEIPIIAVFGSYKSDFVTNLNNLFRNDDYFSIVVSTELLDVFKGYEYLPAQVSIKEFLVYVYKKYNCDVIIININNEFCTSEMQEDIFFDIKVFFSSKEKIRPIYRKRQIGNWDYAMIELNMDSYLDKMNSIYKRIKRILNG